MESFVNRTTVVENHPNFDLRFYAVSGFGQQASVQAPSEAQNGTEKLKIRRVSFQFVQGIQRSTANCSTHSTTQARSRTHGVRADNLVLTTRGTLGVRSVCRSFFFLCGSGGKLNGEVCM